MNIPNLKGFVKDESLIIDKYHWQKLNSSHSKDELKFAISDAIEGLPLPLLPITEEEAKEDLQEVLEAVGEGQEGPCAEG